MMSVMTLGTSQFNVEEKWMLSNSGLCSRLNGFLFLNERLYYRPEEWIIWKALLTTPLT